MAHHPAIERRVALAGRPPISHRRFCKLLPAMDAVLVSVHPRSVCDCSLHCLVGILSLTTLPQLGQKRTGGFLFRWLKLGQGLMFIVTPVGLVAGLNFESL